MSEISSQTEPTRSTAAAGRPAVLVVDDNRANLMAMEALLSSLDLEVRVAASGEDALRELLDRDFVLVLMDVQMPGLDGFKTTELIRQRDRTRFTPVIFVTAIFTDDTSRDRAYSLGALDFLTKPVSDSILKAKVAALVGRYQQADLIERQAEALRAKQREADRADAARLAAEEANRAKDDFLAMLSHELRAPLNSILGWASILEADPASPNAAKAAQTIARSARAQSKLVDELLDVSLIVADKLKIEARVVDLQAIVRAAVLSMQPAAAQKGVRLDVGVGAGAFTTLGDPARLEQLIGHLVSNAIKFSKSGAAVAIDLARDGERLRLRVKDAGLGISPEFLPHVFDRFRQSDGSKTRRYGGLGVGLTVARHLALMHGGDIEVSSAGLGLGAEFVLTLPMPELDATAGAPASAPPRANAEVALAGVEPLHALRILLVDDDEDARELLSTILQDAGAVVASAASAAQALALFAADPFDVLVSDLGMPDEDGLTLLGKIRPIDAGRGGALVAVAVSGYGSADDVKASRHAGFHAHVIKPCDAPGLVALLARLTKPT